jgi:hypothetical protein
LRRKQKEDAEETATKKYREISYLDEDDDGKEVEQDVDKEERKRRERLVILILVQLSFEFDRFSGLYLIMFSSMFIVPVTVANSSEAGTVFYCSQHWDHEFESHLGGMNACLYFSCVYIVLCR